MLLHIERARVEVEAEFGEGDLDLPCRQDLGKPCAAVTRGDLDEEDRVGRIRRAKMAHHRQEGAGNDENDGKEEVSERKAGQIRVVVQRNDATHVGRDVLQSRVIFVKCLFFAIGLGCEHKRRLFHVALGVGSSRLAGPLLGRAIAGRIDGNGIAIVKTASLWLSGSLLLLVGGWRHGGGRSGRLIAKMLGRERHTGAKLAKPGGDQGPSSSERNPPTAGRCNLYQEPPMAQLLCPLAVTDSRQLPNVGGQSTVTVSWRSRCDGVIGVFHLYIACVARWHEPKRMCGF